MKGWLYYRPFFTPDSSKYEPRPLGSAAAD